MGLKLVFACVLAAIILRIKSPVDPVWFETLKISPLTPPRWVFAVIWPIFYCMLGVVGFMLNLETTNKKRLIARNFFNVHIIAVGLWPFLFFKLHHPCYSLVDGVVMAITTLACFLLVPGIRVLLLPYFCWLLFATYLNFEMCSMN